MDLATSVIWCLMNLTIDKFGDKCYLVFNEFSD